MSECEPVVSANQLLTQLRGLGVRRGGVLLVHTSFSRVGPVEGGPVGLIDALQEAVGPEGTLVMPTLSDGADVYDAATTPVFEMGICAELFRQQPGVLRSDHPGASFAARGPAAKRVCATQPLVPPHGIDSPVGRVYELGGQVLLLGVTHSASTMIHLAENLAPVPYSISHPCVVHVDGRPETQLIPEADHCCRGFERVATWLEPEGLEQRGEVGAGTATLADAQDIVRICLERLRAEPLLFLCAVGQPCVECEAARASVASTDGVP